MNQMSAGEEVINVDEATSQPGEHERRATPGEYLDKALHLLGTQLKNVAGVVKELAPEDSKFRKEALTRTSEGLDSVGQFIIDEPLSKNVQSYVSRHPVRTLGISFTLGIVAANALRLLRR